MLSDCERESYRKGISTTADLAVSEGYKSGVRIYRIMMLRITISLITTYRNKERGALLKPNRAC